MSRKKQKEFRKPKTCICWIAVKWCTSKLCFLLQPTYSHVCMCMYIVKLQKTIHTQKYESHKCISFKSLWDPNLPKQCNNLYIHKCTALTNEVTLESSTAFNSCWSFSFLFSRFFLFFSALLLRPPVALPFQQIFNLAMKNTSTNHHQQNKQTS